jgi:hypothetical protein
MRCCPWYSSACPVRVLRLQRLLRLPRRPELLHDRRQLALGLHRPLRNLLLRVPLRLLEPLQPRQLREARQLLRERRRGRVLAEQRRQRRRPRGEPCVARRLALRRESPASLAESVGPRRPLQRGQPRRQLRREIGAAAGERLPERRVNGRLLRLSARVRGAGVHAGELVRVRIGVALDRRLRGGRLLVRGAGDRSDDRVDLSLRLLHDRRPGSLRKLPLGPRGCLLSHLSSSTTRVPGGRLRRGRACASRASASDASSVSTRRHPRSPCSSSNPRADS